MYRIIARDLGIDFKPTDVPRFVEDQHLPDMFLGYIIHSANGLSTMAIGEYNLERIIVTKDFPQMGFKKKLIGKPLIFRRYTSFEPKYPHAIISADVSKIWAPSYGKLYCTSHPKHGKTKKFAPIGKVYNERFCLLPIFKDYK